jgi:hypothetical protein
MGSGRDEIRVPLPYPAKDYLDRLEIGLFDHVVTDKDMRLSQQKPLSHYLTKIA